MPENKPTTLETPLFVVDTPPYLHAGITVQSMMRDTLIALFPAVVMALFTFGLPAFRVMALSMATAVGAEWVSQQLSKQPDRLYDGTSLVTGLLFAFLLPAHAPWWLVIIGSGISVILGRQVFGGIGCNPLCPPLVGWATMVLSWPTQMDAYATVLSTSLIDPLARLKFFGPASLPAGIETNLLFGQQLGGLGSVHIALLTAGGLYLILRRGIRWEIPLAFMGGVLGLGCVFWVLDPGFSPAPHLYLLTGSTVFAAFFLATDHASSPANQPGLLLFGLLTGCMTVLIRRYGIYPDGALFAVLLANLCTPLFDSIRQAPYGKRK